MLALLDFRVAGDEAPHSDLVGVLWLAWSGGFTHLVDLAQVGEQLTLVEYLLAVGVLRKCLCPVHLFFFIARASLR